MKSNHLNNPADYYRLIKPFQLEWLKDVPWHEQLMAAKGYDMTALHTKWNHKVFSETLGKAAVFVTIFRDPSDAFESLYSYMKLQNSYKMKLPDFIQHLDTDPNLARKRINGYAGLNLQMFEFGLTDKDMFNRKAVESKIAEIDAGFDLVMITERMPESLVLLADLLCLPLFMVASLEVNARKPGLKLPLSEEERSILKRHQSADEQLYQHFKAKFQSRIDDFGVERMKESVQELNRINRHVMKNCVIGKTDKMGVKNTKFEPYSKDVLTYKVNENMKQCVRMAESENVFIDELRIAQKERLSNTQL